MGRGLMAFVVAAITIAGPIRGQGNVSAGVPGKSWSFDVVSIRENHDPAAQPEYGPTPSGYRAVNIPVLAAILTAYVPQVGGSAFYQQNQMAGAPDWMMSTRFDIDAKVAEADLADWRKPALQETMLQSMLQGALAERLGLKVHRETKEVSTYSLVVGKSGVKFKETDPEGTHPAGMKVPGGAEVVRDIKDGQVTLDFYGTRISLFATFLSNYAGRPVQDKTGLAGRYDLHIQQPAGGNAQPPPPEGSDAVEQRPSIFAVVEGLGLKLEPRKDVVETLVFDHVERPSAN